MVEPGRLTQKGKSAMKKICCTLSVLCTLSFALALSAIAAPLSQEQLEAIAIQPSSNWGRGDERVVPEMLELFKEESIKFNDRIMKYRLHVPENLEAGKKYPMVLWLHGAGETGSNNKSQLIHLHHILPLLTGERKRDFFLLVPQEPNDGFVSWGTDTTSYSHVAMQTNVPQEVKEGRKTLEKYKEELIEQIKAGRGEETEVTVEETEVTYEVTRQVGGVFGIGARTVREEVTEQMLQVRMNVSYEHPLEFAFAMVDQVLENHPVDPNRITVSGLSTGGDGTWRALERRPELFAAAVPLVSWSPLTDKSMEESPILKKIPIWAIYSSDDNSIDFAREQFERVESAGANVKKTEFGICGHYAWTPAMLQADIFAWMLSRAKDGERYYAVYDPGVDPDDMKGIVDVATRDTRPSPALAPAVDVSPLAQRGAAVVYPYATDDKDETDSVTNATVTTISIPKEDLRVEMPLERLPAAAAERVLAAEANRLTEILVQFDLQLDALTRTLRNPDDPRIIAAIRERDRVIVQLEAVTQRQRAQRERDGVGPPAVGPTGGLMTLPALTPEVVVRMNLDREQAYYVMASRYFSIMDHAFQNKNKEEAMAHLERFARVFRRLPPPEQLHMTTKLLHSVQSAEAIEVLEKLLDGIPAPSAAPVNGGLTPPALAPSYPPSAPAPSYTLPALAPPLVVPQERGGVSPPVDPQERGGVSPPVESSTISAARIIEECDRPWAMTSGSLYGLFAADWDKEAEAVPDFIVNTDSDELAKRLARSVGEDAESKDFIAACRSILVLQHRPMSSPWFETSGGRMRSEIQYSLSAKGQMFVRFLRAVKDSSGSEKARELSKIAERTLEKIDLVLAKE